MDQYINSISLLLEHGHRFFEIWNFQIIIALAAMGYIMSREGLTARTQFRWNVTVIFFLIAVFSVYSLSVHHERELLIWNAMQSRMETNSNELTLAELDYIGSLAPTDFLRKAAALILVDLVVVVITWISPLVHHPHDQLQ